MKKLIASIANALDATLEVKHLPEQSGDAKRTYADISKARRLIGHDPDTPLQEGLQKFSGMADDADGPVLEVCAKKFNCSV